MRLRQSFQIFFGALHWGIMRIVINNTAEDSAHKLPQVMFSDEKENGNHK